jgi:hypothetical protein
MFNTKLYHRIKSKQLKSITKASTKVLLKSPLKLIKLAYHLIFKITCNILCNKYAMIAFTIIYTLIIRIYLGYHTVYASWWDINDQIANYGVNIDRQCGYRGESDYYDNEVDIPKPVLTPYVPPVEPSNLESSEPPSPVPVRPRKLIMPMIAGLKPRIPSNLQDVGPSTPISVAAKTAEPEVNSVNINPIASEPVVEPIVAPVKAPIVEPETTIPISSWKYTNLQQMVKMPLFVDGDKGPCHKTKRIIAMLAERKHLHINSSEILDYNDPRIKEMAAIIADNLTSDEITHGVYLHEFCALTLLSKNPTVAHAYMTHLTLTQSFISLDHDQYLFSSKELGRIYQKEQLFVRSEIAKQLGKK